MRHRWWMVPVGALAVAGCSGEDLAEGFIEDRIEAEAGEDVDIDLDLDDGNISIQSDDGDLSIDIDDDGDGSVSISGSNDDGDFSLESEDGETVIETDDGSTVLSSSGDLPDGFPGSVPVPDGLTVQYSQATATPDGETFLIGGAAAGNPVELARTFADRLEAAGFEQVVLTETPDSVFLGYDDGERYVGATFGPDGEADDSAVVNVTVGPTQRG